MEYGKRFAVANHVSLGAAARIPDTVMASQSKILRIFQSILHFGAVKMTCIIVY
jgi:hypothetical protein